MAWFLKMDGHDGESKEQAGYVNLLSWSFGANLSVPHTGTTSAQVAGQSEVHDVTVSLVTDKSFVEMWKTICSGNPVASAEILGTKDIAGSSGGKPKTFFETHDGGVLHHNGPSVGQRSARLR